MSSATSTEDPGHPVMQGPHAGDPGLRPWQFFLLAGMLSATGVVLVVGGQSPASIIVLSITVVAASLVALGTYRAFSPLVVPEITAAPPLLIGRTRAALEREKALVLRSIKELEFDFAMKKIARNDFEEMSARLRARAVGLMRQLDESSGYRVEIEREIDNRLRASQHEVAGSSRGNERATENARPEVEALMHCQCGTVNDPDAKFCKNCGSKLAAA